MRHQRSIYQIVGATFFPGPPARGVRLVMEYEGRRVPNLIVRRNDLSVSLRHPHCSSPIVVGLSSEVFPMLIPVRQSLASTTGDP